MNKKIRVLHIITRLAGGGADENTIYTVQELNKKKYRVDLMTGIENLDMMIDNLKFNEDSKLYVIDKMVRNVSPLKDILALNQIYKIIKMNNYDIVHTHIAKAGVLGRTAAELAAVPHIIHSLHGITFPKTIHPFKRIFYLLVERFCALYTDYFLAVGEDIKEKYIKAKVGKSNQYRVIYSGMDLDKFIRAANYEQKMINKIKDEFSIDHDKLIIGCVAALEKRKGHQYLFKVFKRLKEKHDNIMLLVVGRGERKEYLSNLTNELGLTKDIVFTGYRNNIENIFAVIDIKVLTSFWEGLPRVLIQAAAMKIPIVSFAAEGVSEIVKDGKNGYIIDIYDTKDFYEKLSALIKDPNLRKIMGENQVFDIKEKWSYQQMVKKIDHFYRKLL